MESRNQGLLLLDYPRSCLPFSVFRVSLLLAPPNRVSSIPPSCCSDHPRMSMPPAARILAAGKNSPSKEFAGNLRSPLGRLLQSRPDTTLRRLRGEPAHALKKQEAGPASDRPTNPRGDALPPQPAEADDLARVLRCFHQRRRIRAECRGGPAPGATRGRPRAPIPKSGPRRRLNAGSAHRPVHDRLREHLRRIDLNPKPGAFRQHDASVHRRQRMLLKVVV